MNAKMITLAKKYEKLLETPGYPDLDVIKSEMERIYYGSNELLLLNKKAILLFIIINRSLKIIPFHLLGANLEDITL